MGKIDEILNQLTDKELAYFVKYKLKTYIESTQAYILKYIENTRGVTTNQLSLLIKDDDMLTVKSNYQVCKRCGSEKMFAYNVAWHIPVFQVGYEDEFASLYERATGKEYRKTKIECFVCGNIVVNPNNEGISLWKKICRAFLG